MSLIIFANCLTRRNPHSLAAADCRAIFFFFFIKLLKTNYIIYVTNVALIYIHGSAHCGLQPVGNHQPTGAPDGQSVQNCQL